MPKELEISKRIKNLPPSPMRQYIPILESVKKKGIEVLELHIGQPDLPTPKEFFEKVKTFKKKTLSYTHSLGPLELRKAWQKYFQIHQLNFEISEIISTIGGSEAIFFALAVVGDEGDNILVFEPTFPAYISFAKMLGIELRAITLTPENKFHLKTKKEIEEKIDQKTKAILICHPNNPTGTLYTREELEMIREIALKRNLFIISDETYREFSFERKHFSFGFFKDLQERVIILESLSKKFNLCGARIGCLASKNPAVIEGVTKIAQARLSLPAIEAEASVSLLEKAPKYIKKFYLEYKKRREIVFREIKKIEEVFCIKPEGGIYFMIKIPVPDSNEFTKWLVSEFSFKGKTLMVTPGSGFYVTPNLGKNEIRIALVLPPKKLKQAIKILKIALQEFKNYGN